MNYCKPSENLAGNFSQSFPYSVSGSIVSTQAISNGFTVRYEAGTYIELNSGFVSGTDFVAEINPCVSVVSVIAAKTDDVIEESKQTANDIGVNNIKIYPTVVASGAAINMVATETTLNLNVSIFDLQGKIAQYATIPELYAHEPHVLLLSSLASGLYFVRAQGSSIFITQRIIVK